MPPIRRGRTANRARTRVGRRSRFGRLRQNGVGNLVGIDGDNQGAAVPMVIPPAGGNSTPAGFDPRKLEELITESIAKGVELGIAKALSVVEGGPSTVPTPTPGSATVAQAPATQGSASVIVPATLAQVTPPVGHTPLGASISPSIEMHSISASSLPPQIPGRPGLDATARANSLNHLVPQKVKDKIWAKEYVELSTLLQEEDQEMELQISSQSLKPTFTLVPKSKKEVNTIAKWIKAFNCFTAVYSRKWPEEVPGLLKHMEVVIGLSDANANWRSYDISFRKLHANGLERFGQINIDLYLMASRGPFRDSAGRFGDNKDGKSGKGGAQERLARHPLGFCFNFHNGRKCTRCNFKHSCYNCNESHRVSDCTKAKSAAGGKGGTPKEPKHSS